MKADLILVLMTAGLVLGGCDRRTADYTCGETVDCELHQTHMTKTNVPIVYGLIRLNEWGRALEVASSNSFPHAEECVLGGCIVYTPTQAVIYICSDCQRARKRLESDHVNPR